MADDSVIIAPHRGFSNKAREVLLGHDGYPRMPPKSSSEYDLRKRLKLCSLIKRTDSQNTTSNKSQSSTQSVQDPPCFDSIGEEPTVKHHFKLSQIGKTKSCVEFKTTDKRLIRTFQEDNVLKMPSMDSDMDSLMVTKSDYDILDVNYKTSLYAISDEEKKRDVKKWLEQSQ
ncbi:unnamed protein product [Auanema sp. JU1783]|nr:unnamed protein product [Auanema sp. JU1783]